MALNLGKITVSVGPHDLGAADNLERIITSFIGGAKASLDVAVQELESEPITRALIAAKRRGVRLRIVLEGDYLIADKGRAEPFTAGGVKEPNRRMLNALYRASIDVRSDYNAKIFHQKFMVRDIGKASQALLTGSTNFTPTGVHSNLNHLITVANGRVAREYHNEFEEIWGGTFGNKRLRHEPAPRNNRVSGIRIRAIFAPDHSPEMEIMKQMLKAQNRIDFAIFTFSERASGIDDTMIALQKAGINVRGVFDAGQGNRDWAATRGVAGSGAEVFLASRRQGLNKLHHKLMVIDDQLVIAGSFNYTAPANRLNDENILVIGDLAETRAESRTRQGRIAQHLRAEIDRIIQVHGRRVQAS